MTQGPWERRAPARQPACSSAAESSVDVTSSPLRERLDLGRADGRAGVRRSRGAHWRRPLPHFDAPGALQHLTYRLADALPRDGLVRLDAELAGLPESYRYVERRRRIEAWLDAGHGSCVLRRPEAAHIVVETWARFDGERYRLQAFVVMPNHCHVLIETFNGFPLPGIVNSWKSYTARWINRHVLGRAGARRSPGSPKAFWQRDYWDRCIRNEAHFHAAVAYIENNPVKAGLVRAPGDCRWSSAARSERV